MIFSKIWERYFIKETLKIFFLFLVSFYGLYVIIDYASHTSALPHHQTQIKGLILLRYYLFIFASRAEILIPFALLIAVIKTLLTLNTRQELVALLVGGVPLKTLMRPFLFLGLVCVALLYLNEQFVLPHALKSLRGIEETGKKSKRRHQPDMAVQNSVLADNSLVLYQSFDPNKGQFFDLYWVRSVDDIYRMKFLDLSKNEPIGEWVDHFVRDKNGEMFQVESFEKRPFPEIIFTDQSLSSTLADPEAMSLTELGSELSSWFEGENEKESKMLTAFYWKLFIPWLSLLAVIAPIPFCIKFSRQQPLFMIYVCGIFGLVAFYMLMDATLVIAKRQVAPPLIAIGTPFVITYALFGWRYIRIR